MNVEHKEYASKGVAGTGLGLGIAGTALSLLQGGNCGNGNVLNRLFGGNCGNGCGNGGLDPAAMQAVLAENAQLKAERYSDGKADALKENLLRDWLKPLSDRAAEQMAKEARMQAEIDCLKQTTELKLQLAQKEIDLARQEAKCCCDKTNMRVDCLEEKVDGITKTVVAAAAVEKSA